MGLLLNWGRMPYHARMLEMDQVSANLSKQDPGQLAKSNRGKVTRR
jgi:hypothetical protein